MSKYLFLLMMLINFLYASISMNSVDEFYSGEPLSFTIEAAGNDITFPIIQSVSGFKVTKNGSSNSVSIINGHRTQKLTQGYVFYPNKTVIIPKFKIIVDGKAYFTQEKEVKLLKVQKTKSQNMDLSINVSNKELYVGEQTIFSLIFKYRRDFNIVDLGLNAPVFNGFWSKQIGKASKYTQGAFEVQELKYVIFPQKSGDLKIPSLKADVSIVDGNSRMSFFGPPVKIEKVYSNELNLNVKALPKDVFLIGDFNITTVIDKQNLEVGEALNFDIEIKGRGNIDDIPELKLDISNATIYNNKATKSYDMIDGLYGGTYKKSFSIVPNEDLVIPTIVLKYFDNRAKSIKALTTKEFNIKVNQKSVVKKNIQLHKEKSGENSIKKKEIINTLGISSIDKLLYLFFGFLFSSFIFVFVFFFLKFKSKKRVESTPLIIEVKKAKNRRSLRNVLLCYININQDLDKIIYLLDSTESCDFKKIKTDVLNILKESLIGT